MGSFPVFFNTKEREKKRAKRQTQRGDGVGMKAMRPNPLAPLVLRWRPGLLPLVSAFYDDRKIREN